MYRLGRLVFGLLASVALAAPAAAQVQAIDGIIEGTVFDAGQLVLPGVTVTVTNMETGVSRTVVSNERGAYRTPPLRPGVYRLEAELPGFRSYVQTGITVRAGGTAVVNVTLDVGEITEIVMVTADSPIVDSGRLDLGRTLNEREIKTLPLTSRNPYNFGLLQPGVTGFETQEFGVPRMTAGGALLRVNYQIDGNNNTQKDRAGLRQMPMSEVMIREVQVVTSGYAPEFGQTMGMVYNAITPSGTNVVRGQGSYRFQRKDFAAFPFFFTGERTPERKPLTKVDVVTFDIGGPIVRDRAHFFGGFENARRDLSGGRVITVSPANAQRLGLSPQPGGMPAALDTKFGVGKLDYELSPANRLSARYIIFDNAISNNIGGGLNTVERATDFSDRQHSAAVQLVSTIGANRLNELRVQYATRDQGRVPGEFAGTGPAINIPAVANFGSANNAAAAAGFAFQQNVFQIINNFTYLQGNHSYKFGVDVQHVADTRRQSQFQLYTFPTIDAYLAARDGVNPFGYTSFVQFFGDPSREFSSNLYGFFVQDDWRVSPDLKVLYGVRYDVYDVPSADPNAPFDSSRSFRVDRNNWGPRAGMVWTFGADRRSVVRANTGLMYDQPLLAMYERALQEDGSDQRVTVNVTPASAGAPAFPNTLEALPPGFVPPRQSISTVDPGFSVARTWQNTIQYERGLGDLYAAVVGYTHSRGTGLPVISNINPINPIGQLADGRPVFSPAVSAATRLDPRFNNINAVQSIGESTYNGLMLQLRRRWSEGFQFDLAYTLSKAEDNAPITSVLSVQGDVGGRSDPASLERDRGPNILDQRHTFSASIVGEPSFSLASPAMRAILNNNQFGLLVVAGSGLPVNVRSNRELNNDGIGSDRPIGIGRNSMNLPARLNVDLRYARQVRLGGGTRAEILGEFKNVFNTVQWSGVASVVPTDAEGNLLSPLPARTRDFNPTGGYEHRQFQLGLKVNF